MASKAAAAKKDEQPASKWAEPLSKKLWPAIPRKDWWSWDRIKPYVHNARTHPPAQIALLAQLLRRHGPDQPIVVDEKGVILKGHGRRLAGLEGELDGFWVTQRLGLSEEDKVAMRIADNQIALLAGWDRELVRMEMHRLEAAAYPMELLGFGKAELVAFQTVPGPPGAFPTFGEDIEAHYECPKCHYKWSGKPRPDADGDKSPPPKSKRKKR